MGRRAVSWETKRDVASRVQRVLDERFGSFYAFDKAMRAQGRAALASTVHNWLPPQERWKAKPDGAAVRRVDWAHVRLPDPATLMDFCTTLEVRADYILFGDGVPDRGQSRTKVALERDIARYVAREARVRAAAPDAEWMDDIAAAEKIDVRAILDDAVRVVMANAHYENTIGRMQGQLYELQALAVRLAEREQPVELVRWVESALNWPVIFFTDEASRTPRYLKTRGPGPHEVRRSPLTPPAGAA